MKNNQEEHQKFLDKLSPMHKKLLEQSQENIKKLHASPPPPVIRLDPSVKTTPPLVQRVQPNTIVGGVKPATFKPFIQPVTPKMSENQPTPVEIAQAGLKEGTYTFDGFQDFYLLSKKHAELMTEPEVSALVKFVDEIPSKCGCVRGALNESAQGQFSQLLPLVHARNPTYFDKLKQITNSSKIVFKEKGIILLEV